MCILYYQIFTQSQFKIYMNTYRPLNISPVGKQTNLRKGFKMLCLACGLLMYLVVLTNNYQSNKKYSPINSLKNGRHQNYLSRQYNHNINEVHLNSHDNDQNTEFFGNNDNTDLQNIDYDKLKARQKSIYFYLKSIKNDLTPAKQYRNISSVTKFKQLSFCIITSSPEPQPIFQSLQNQNYSNFKLIYRGQFPKIESSKAQFIKSDPDLLPIRDQIVSYYCGSSSIILLVNDPVKENALSELNELYQKKNIWLTYEIFSDEKIAVSSFMGNIFLNLRRNDPSKIKAQKLSNNINFIVLSLLQLSKLHSESYESQKISTNQSFYLSTKLQPTLFDIIYHHKAYQPLFTLSQTYKIDQQHIVLNYNKMLENQTIGFQERGNITQQQMLQAIQYTQLKNLHQNHSLFDRQRIYYETKYKLSKFSKQLSLCVVIPSFNNIEKERYQKVMQTVMYQDYSNYHMVFIDDFSTDETLALTRKFLTDKGFDMKKISFLRNKEKKFSTYNIRHAAQDYCQKKEIMVILDGDDELVGRYVFKLLNYKYHIRDNWVVYSNYYNSDYAYGVSEKLDESFFVGEGRQYKRYFGSIMSFYVDLFRSINEKDFKDENGDYLTTDIKITLQYPLLEMAGLQHTEYVPEICYFFNKYQGNSDLSIEKAKKQEEMKTSIVSRNRYERVKYLYDR